MSKLTTIVQKVLGKKSSAQTAKERLKALQTQDRATAAPEQKKAA